MTSIPTIRMAAFGALLIVVGSVGAKPGVKPLTDEQVEERLRQSSLEIDRDCKPGLLKRAHLAASPNARRNFWVGQRYAIASTVQAEYAARRARAISDQADRQIEAIENRRDAAMGIPQTPMDPKLAEEIAKTDRLLAKTDVDRLSSTHQWAKKCRQVADTEVLLAEKVLRTR